MTHKVPWIVIAYKFLKKWQEKNGNRVPSNFKEKSELKKMIQEGEWESMDLTRSEPFHLHFHDIFSHHQRRGEL